MRARSRRSSADLSSRTRSGPLVDHSGATCSHSDPSRRRASYLVAADTRRREGNATIVGLAVAFGIPDARVHKWLVIVLAVTGFAVGIWGFFLPTGSFAKGNVFGVANLENPG